MRSYIHFFLRNIQNLIVSLFNFLKWSFIFYMIFLGHCTWNITMFVGNIKQKLKCVVYFILFRNMSIHVLIVCTWLYFLERCFDCLHIILFFGNKKSLKCVVNFVIRMRHFFERLWVLYSFCVCVCLGFHRHQHMSMSLRTLVVVGNC